MDVHHYSGIDKSANSRLYVECITSKPVYRINANDVAGPRLLQELCEAGALSGHHATANALINKLPLERPMHRPALSLDALVSGRDTIVGDAHLMAHKLEGL